jgi:hypothetical protein
MKILQKPINLFVILVMTITMIFGLSGLVNAADPQSAADKALSGLDTTADPAGLKVDTTKFNLPTVIGKALSILMSILGLIFLIIVVYGGVKWMTAKGEAKEVEDARSMIIQGAIGLAVTLATYSIAYYVISEITKATGVGAS